tara:strand:- start:1071 stop:2558 length:1488 start_codon:yes stop_codon:yes gene_type:complete
MVTLVANQLDNNYSQTQINAFYTQAKKLIEEPFDFWVFTTQQEMDVINKTMKKEGFIDNIQFHVPKYGKDWIEIDLMERTKPGESLLFITPNVILNNISVIETYKTNRKLLLEDGNLCYVLYHNSKVEKILKEWNKNEDDLLYNFDVFSEKFLIDEGDIPFIQNATASYPETTDEDIVALPYWYEDYTPEQVDKMYNKATDLYPYLPERVQFELSNGQEYLTLDQVRESFCQDFMEKAHLKRIKFKGLGGDSTGNPEMFDIAHYFMKEWGIGVDMDTTGINHDSIWWNNVGMLFKETGNITFNINTGNPDKKIFENAKALIATGCRVFWSYTHTRQLDNDIQKAKKLCKQYGFTGFVYVDEVPEEVIPKKKVVKQELPDYKLIELETLETRKKDDTYKERKIKFSPHVKCEGKVNNQFYLSAKGNVFPCKHVALTIETAETSPEHKTEFLYDWSKNNINNYTLEEIFTNDFYKGYFNNLLKLNPKIIHDEQGGVC